MMNNELINKQTASGDLKDQQNHPFWEKLHGYSKEDIRRITEAYAFAKEVHTGQTRKSGEPYIDHPLAVAEILVDLGLDASTIMAALLHDVVEDTEVTLEEVEKRFGSDVSHLVDGVTKLGRIKYKSSEEQQAENHRKMFVAMAKDVRVIVIKLADRLHNMRTLNYLPEEKRRRIANETLEIFAPLAHRLGISTIKWELEDISLRYLNPQQYYRIVNLMQKKRAERELYIEDVIQTLHEKLSEVGILADISGRPKHIYSIYHKMVYQKKQFNQIYDLLAVRVIVNSIKDCYAVLGIIHTLWKPIPGRFKDYIAMPKPNMYQSLHTTVIGPKGEPLEVQIRTWEMHRTAEYGVAAHWAYKEDKTLTVDEQTSENLSWFREILEWQQDFRDAREFMESLKTDLFSDSVFVFTPKGDVIELPTGSVPLDFAYRIHTEIGNRCIGAKVNGKIVPLDRPLQTGDIVEILISKHSYGPSRDWLKIAQTSHARGKIRQWFKKERRGESLEKGGEMLTREIKRIGFSPDEILKEGTLAEIADDFNFNDTEDMLAAIGYGGISAGQVATRLVEKVRKETKQQLMFDELGRSKEAGQKKPLRGVRAKGADNLLVRFSRCCNPVPGDPIVGFVTKGRGISVHRADCPNLQQQQDKDRIIEVEWEEDPDVSYPVDIEVTGYDRRGFLNDVLQTVTNAKTHISAVSGRSDKNKVATITMTINIHNLEHLQAVVNKVKDVKDMYSVRRITQ